MIGGTPSGVAGIGVLPPLTRFFSLAKPRSCQVAQVAQRRPYSSPPFSYHPHGEIEYSGVEPDAGACGRMQM